MTTAWQYYTRNLSAETLKCKRTSVGWLAAGAPLFITFISFSVYYFNGHELIKPGEDPWLRLLNHYRQVWPLILFPLTITLQSALYPAIEHQSNTWKHVYSLAVPRWSVYAGKLTLFTALVALSMAMLFVFTEGVGVLLGLLRPTLGFGRDTAHATIARECSKLFLSALGMTAIQFYVGFRFRHFVLPVGFGLLMTIAAIALGPWQHITRFPYAWPVLTWPRTYFGPTFIPAFYTKEIVLSVLVFAVVSVLGYFETARRDVA